MEQRVEPARPFDWHGLVNERDLTVSREIFVDPRMYRIELDRVFTHCWLFVGHTSQIPNRGDYFLSRMGDESVIVTRDPANRIHVFLNSCRHRGMKVCRYDQGNATEFPCPYHGWTYTLDGRLEGVPFFAEYYGKLLDKSKWGLVEARLTDYRGTLWATWDRDLVDLETYLGGARYHLDEFLNTPTGDPEQELEVIGGIQKWVLPCNWKFGAENFAGDNYHNLSHQSVDRLKLSPSGKAGRHQFDAHRKIQLQNISFPAFGHSARGMLLPAEAPYNPLYAGAGEEVEAYFRAAYAARKARLGDVALFNGQGGTLFPNMSFSNGRLSIALWHPLGPETMEAWRFYLVPKDAPQSVKDVLRHYAIRYQGPGGLTEQDDMENWERAAAASRGTVASRYPYNLELGHHDVADEGDLVGMKQIGGRVTPGMSEENQRGFYRRWVQMMAGEN